MQWLASISVKRPVFATRHHPLADRHRRIRVHADWASTASRRSTSPPSSSRPGCPGPRLRKSRPRSPTRSRKPSTPSAGSTSFARTRPRACRRSSSRSCSRRTPTSRAQEVRDRVNRVLPLLPKTIEQPTVEKFDPDSAPVLTLAVSANKPIRDITEYADKTLRRQLESVNGVGQVVVVGRPRAPDQHLARRRRGCAPTTSRSRTCRARFRRRTPKSPAAASNRAPPR